MASPAATTKTATAGIYCKQCGYDLRGSLEGGEAKRCPECGRVFSPEDPKSFRPRPFAAPWKRALGRWVKRVAILLLVVGFLLGGTWGWLYWGWKQEQAVPAQAGGTEWELSRVILGGAPGRWLHDRRIPGCFVLERIGRVDLPVTATDAHLFPLRKLLQLRSLGLSGRQVTDAGIAHLTPLTALQGLDLRDTRVTDAALAHLAKLPELRSLWLSHAPITDAGLVHLAKLPRLEWLRLDHTPVSEAGLVHLHKLPRLERLDLSGTQVTDAGLVHLATLPSLRGLALSDTRVTDAGLGHLETLRALRALNLTGTKVTPAGAERLKAALPGCVIVGP